MSRQISLTSFFKPMQTKRVSTDSHELDSNAKKPKLETCDEPGAFSETESKQLEKSEQQSSPETEKIASVIPKGPQGSLAVPPKGLKVRDTGEDESDKNNFNGKGEQVKENGASCDEATYSQRSTQEARDTSVNSKKPVEEQTNTQHSIQESTDPKEPDDTKKTTSTDDTKVLNDVTKEDENKTNFTTPVKSETKFISTPLGMLSPLQCLAKIKSQCAKTPALHHTIGSSWFFALQGEFTKPYFNKLSQFLVAERKKATIYPPENQVWTWTQLCTMKDVKVVILGQDPYHNPGQAHGLCFSVQKGVPPPPSLVNMYKELEDDIPGFKAPSHGILTGWAQQGVLLLNACLTVRANSANSHKDQGWEQLTDAVITRLSDTSSGIVFLLWGSYAHKKGAVVNKKKHHILKSVHPSPLSAHRGFFGCKHFSKCNALLKQGGKKPIDWAYLPVV